MWHTDGQKSVDLTTLNFDLMRMNCGRVALSASNLSTGFDLCAVYIILLISYGAFLSELFEAM